jgi:hypothetical protein
MRERRDAIASGYVTDKAMHMSWADVRKELRSQQQDEMDDVDRRD